MTEPVQPLDPAALAALRRDREAPAPSEARARVARRLADLLVLPEGAHGGSRGTGGTEQSAPGPSSAAAAGAGFGAWRAIAVGAFLVGGAVGAALYAAFAASPSRKVIFVDRPVATAPMEAQPPPTLPTQAPAPTLARIPEVPPRTPSAPPPLSPSSRKVSQLDGERALLDGVRLALERADGPSAISDLERYERTYPRPMLDEEREALLVEALVRVGRYDEARAHAAAFRRRAPASLLLPTVAAAVGSIP